VYRGIDNNLRSKASDEQKRKMLGEQLVAQRVLNESLALSFWEVRGVNGRDCRRKVMGSALGPYRLANLPVRAMLRYAWQSTSTSS